MEVRQCLAAPHCDSTHSYGFRSLITCTISLISRLRWTESRRTTRTATTNSMVSCEINNLQFINRFISSKAGFIYNEEPLDPAPLPYTPWRALDRNVPDADKKYTSSRAWLCVGQIPAHRHQTTIPGYVFLGCIWTPTALQAFMSEALSIAHYFIRVPSSPFPKSSFPYHGQGPLHMWLRKKRFSLYKTKPSKRPWNDCTSGQSVGRDQIAEDNCWSAAGTPEPRIKKTVFFQSWSG